MQVGDVGRMKRGDKLARVFVVARIDRIQNAFDELRAKPVFFVHDGVVGEARFVGDGCGGDVLALAHATFPQARPVSASYCRASTGATRIASLNRPQFPLTGALRWPTTTALSSIFPAAATS